MTRFFPPSRCCRRNCVCGLVATAALWMQLQLILLLPSPHYSSAFQVLSRSSLSSIPSFSCTRRKRKRHPPKLFPLHPSVNHPPPSSFRSQQQSSSTSSTSSTSSCPVVLWMGVIEANELDFEFDVGQGGVRLAKESAVAIKGTVSVQFPKSSSAAVSVSASAKLDELVRYRQLRKIPQATVALLLLQTQQEQQQIIAIGSGTESYVDPGRGVEAVVTYAPIEAVRDALLQFELRMQKKKKEGDGGEKEEEEELKKCTELHVNFLGGDDLQVLEVLDAVQQLVLGMIRLDNNDDDSNHQNNNNPNIFRSKGGIRDCPIIRFCSISDAQFPAQTATVTVVGYWTSQMSETSSVTTTKVLSDDSESHSPVVEGIILEPESSILIPGSIFFRDDIYYTTSEDDINPNIA